MQVEITLVQNWAEVLKKAWSVKFNALSIIFGALEVFVAIYQPEWIPRGMFAGIAAIISVIANVARIMVQKELPGPGDTQKVTSNVT